MRTMNGLNGYGAAYDLLAAPHILIAGASGSGKSYALNNVIIYSLLAYPPDAVQLLAIDVKRVELAYIKRLPHFAGYADTPEQAARLLRGVLVEVERRFCDMSRRGLRSWPGSALYIIIDELADLLTLDTARNLPLLQRIGQIGRAAGVHIIAATQAPSRAVIPAALAVNLTGRLALHCSSRIESRQALGLDGAEELPWRGVALLRVPGADVRRIEIPPGLDAIAAARVEYWTKKD